ncbi:MAG: hypothetical protein JWO82_496 [Akkermansiaceae bacterium]|nr:hypothetical protein [Akkermansiaceae bacterium]
MKRLCLLTFFSLSCLVFAKGDDEDEKKPPIPLDETVFSDTIWSTPLETIKGPDPVEDEARAKLREKLKAKGIDLGKVKSDGFDWLSSEKQAIRADPKKFTLLTKPIGEVVIRGKANNPVDVSISLYNRGDDGEISVSNYTQKLDEWKAALDVKLGVRSAPREDKGPVPMTGWMWKKGDTAVLLEGSMTKAEKRPEFVRLRFASVAAAKTDPGGVGRRNSFAANVKHDGNYTYIDGVPMVDQGQKGYCVVASVERVARYFGADIDQHEMAQLANTDEDGTTGDGMEKAFQKITGKIHLRTLKHIEFSNKQLEQDVKSYNRAAKTAGVKTFDIDLKEYYVNAHAFWSVADKPTFRAMKAAQPGFAQFTRKIKEYVDQGIPLFWTLQLGMFKEEGLPQTYGGHMSLIIGYDEKDGTINYTDSWGEGHERKSMRADEAYCMTMAMYTMVPNK